MAGTVSAWASLPMAETDRPWRALAPILAPHRKRILGVAVATVAGALSEATLLILLTGTLVAYAQGQDVVGVRGTEVSVDWVPLIGAVILLLRFLLNVVTVRSSANLTAKVTSAQRFRLTVAYLGASWAVQQQEPSGRLQELVSGFVARVGTTVTALVQGLTAALSLVAFIGAGAFIDPLATLVMLGVLALLGLVVVPLRRRIRRQSSLLANNNLAYARTISELGSLGLEMRTFGVRGRFIERLEEASAVQVEGVRRVQMLSGLTSPVYTVLAYAAILAGVAGLGRVGDEQLAAIGAVLLLLLRSLTYGQQLATVQGTLAGAMPFVHRLETEVRYYTRARQERGGTTPAALGALRLRNVELSYSVDRPPALRGVSMTIHQGEMLGVIGESGAGKSSLAQVILGLREASSGSVTVDGVAIADIDPKWWAKHTGFVAQEALLISGSVADNIRFFRAGIDDVTARQSAMQANVAQDIERLPNGYDTDLGERGSQLSGGQRQRLSIARALAGEPDLLVLDEPTSALDGESEALIRQTLAVMKGRITIVIIAHRLSTLEMCDRIAVIENGALTAIETPETLRRTSAFFRRALDIAGLGGQLDTASDDSVRR